MSSKLLKKGSELYSKRKESPDQGLLAKWAGKDMKSGNGIIAPCSKGRQYEAGKHAAPRRSASAVS